MVFNILFQEKYIRYKRTTQLYELKDIKKKSKILYSQYSVNKNLKEKPELNSFMNAETPHIHSLV